MVVSAYDYTAFGNERRIKLLQAYQSPWRYAAKRFDFDLSLVNFGKRDYDPILGAGPPRTLLALWTERTCMPICITIHFDTLIPMAELLLLLRFPYLFGEERQESHGSCLLLRQYLPQTQIATQCCQLKEKRLRKTRTKGA